MIVNVFVCTMLEEGNHIKFPSVTILIKMKNVNIERR